MSPMIGYVGLRCCQWKTPRVTALSSAKGARIRAFREKPEQPKSGMINSGVYWLRKTVLDVIGDGPCSLEQNVFPQLATSGQLIGRDYRGYFIDIGIPEDLEKARLHLHDELRKPAAFLDRDGTLNYDDGYTHKIEGFRWIENAVEAVKALNDAGYLVFVVTNQAGIARGYYDADAVNTLHQWMQQELASVGAHIDDFRFCPHHLEGTIPELSIACDCRKPGTAMLESLISQWQPRLERSFMLGDKDKDAEAGQAAGMLGVRIEPADILQEVRGLIAGPI